MFNWKSCRQNLICYRWNKHFFVFIVVWRFHNEKLVSRQSLHGASLRWHQIKKVWNVNGATDNHYGRLIWLINMQYLQIAFCFFFPICDASSILRFWMKKFSHLHKFQFVLFHIPFAHRNLSICIRFALRKTSMKTLNRVCVRVNMWTVGLYILNDIFPLVLYYKTFFLLLLAINSDR